MFSYDVILQNFAFVRVVCMIIRQYQREPYQNMRRKPTQCSYDVKNVVVKLLGYVELAQQILKRLSHCVCRPKNQFVGAITITILAVEKYWL